MAASPILTVVVGDTCSLCEVALDRLRVPARLLGVSLTTEHLDVGANREDFGIRVPVVLDDRRRVLAEGRISSIDAWRAVGAARMSAVRR